MKKEIIKSGEGMRWDDLTSMFSRECFLEKLQVSLGKQLHASLIYLDLDQFNLVNDIYGCHIGDELLQQVAGLISATITSSSLCGRLGNDEFGILLFNAEERAHLCIAESLSKAVSEHSFLIDGHGIKITASLGLVVMKGEYADGLDVLRDARAACYLAAEKGPSIVCQHRSSDAISLASANWAVRVGKALRSDSFLLYFQLLKPFSTYEKTHCEVLIRMLGDGGDVVAPEYFMPIVERYFLATRIDTFVVDKVFNFVETGTSFNSNDFVIAINLSGQSLNNSSFRDYLYNKVSNANFSVDKICFEITETVALNSLDEIGLFVKKMKALGVKFALDDFGSGASTFSYLRKIPFDFIKIDRQFITSLDEDEVNQLIVRCLSQVAKKLGAQTIAECVQTEGVYQALKVLDIDFIQGSFHHNPQLLEPFFKSVIE